MIIAFVSSLNFTLITDNLSSLNFKPNHTQSLNYPQLTYLCNLQDKAVQVVAVELVSSLNFELMIDNLSINLTYVRNCRTKRCRPWPMLYCGRNAV